MARFFIGKLKEIMPEDTTDIADATDSGVDVDALASAFLSKFQSAGNKSEGASLAAIGQLLKDNQRYRKKIAELKKTSDDLKSKVPEDGTVAVPEAEYKALVELREENEKASDFAARVKRGMEAIAEVETLKRDGVLRDAAELAGYNFTVLRDRSQGLTVEIEGEGDERKAVVEVEGTKTELAEYAEANWGDYLPALQKEGTTPTSRPAFPRQPSGRPPTTSVARPVEEIKADKDKDRRYVAI